MKIDEAIKLLEDSSGLGYKYAEYGLDQALRLGIEALKRLAFNRLYTIASSNELLPGETIESNPT